jgi:hypothetical protein
LALTTTQIKPVEFVAWLDLGHHRRRLNMSRRFSLIFTQIILIGLVAFPISVSSTRSVSAAPPDEVCTISQDNPVVVRLEAGESATLSFDDQCQPIVTSGVSDTAPTDPNGYSQATTVAETPHEASSGGEADTLLVSQKRCNARSQVHDVVHFRLTEALVYADWRYDGVTTVQQVYGATNAAWLLDWNLVDGPYAFWYTPSGSSYYGFEGWADYDFDLGGFWHEHRAILSMSAWGGCSAENYFSGSICNSCHTHFDVYTS